MKLARFWSRQTAEAPDRDGRPVRAAARGWSNDSVEAATTMALAVAQRVAQIIAGGQTKLARYQYGDRPIPEPVTREFVDGPDLFAVVTRNIYGAFVLNARDLMFVDIDVESKPDQSVKSVVSGLLSMFGRKPEPVTPASDPHEDAVRRVADQHGLPIRLYETAGGYRAIITRGSYDSTAEQTQALLREFGADPLYIHLCKQQESFRARLSPKPWRIGMRPPTVSFPYETADERSRFDDWAAKYQTASAPYATCRFVGQFGAADIAPGFTELIAYHDQETKASSALPLA